MAENIQPNGVRFHICLPVDTAPTSDAASKSSAAINNTSDASRDKARLLVVDDEDMIRSVIHTALTLRGYRITEAANGFEALEKFQKTSPPFDLVLMDIGLPDIDGWTVLEKMRALRPGVQVLMISGDTANEQVQRYATDAGVMFLAKPYANDDLMKAVHKALAQQSKPVA